MQVEDKRLVDFALLFFFPELKFIKGDLQVKICHLLKLFIETFLWEMVL